MINKNVAEYTDFNGKTNKKIVQAPGGNSSISFFWGDIQPKKAQTPQRNSYSRNTEEIDNTYSQIYGTGNKQQYGGALGYRQKSNYEEAGIHSGYHIPSQYQQKLQNNYSQNVDRDSYSRVDPHSNSVNYRNGLGESGYKNINDHKSGNYANYSQNQIKYREKYEQDSINRQGTHQKGNALINQKTLLSQYQNESIYALKQPVSIIQNPEHGQQMISADHKNTYQMNARSKNNQNLYANNNSYPVYNNSAHLNKSEEEGKNYSNRENLDDRQKKQIKSTSLIHDEGSRRAQKERGKQIVYSRQYSRPYPVENTAKIMLQKSADKLEKLDQIDIVINQQTHRKYPHNIHSHPNHQRNTLVPKPNPRRKKNTQQTKPESPPSRPCIRLTSTPPKNSLIFGDPTYNYWKDPENDQTHKDSRISQQNDEPFGKRVQSRNFGDERTGKKLIYPHGGRHNFKIQ